MKVEFLLRFNKDILKIADQKIKNDIANSIADVEGAKSLKEIKNIKKLLGTKIYYRIKVGDYRIGISVERNIVTFVRVAHRKDIYKLFP